jgi:hypothetical protein
MLFFGFLSPNANSFVIIPAFILVTVNLFIFLNLFMHFFVRVVPLKEKVKKRIVIVLATSLSIIVALQSIGQLTVRDVVTIVPLVGLLYFYLSYAESRSPKR